MFRIATMSRALIVAALFSPLACTAATPEDPASPAEGSKNIRGALAESTGHLRGLNMDPRFGRPCEAGHASFDQLRYLGIGRVRVHPKLLAGETFEGMVATFRDIIAGYRGAGIEVLVVLNEETIPGAGPGRIGDWANESPTGWANYVEKFAAASATIAAELGEGVSYEIWNEPDDLWHDDGGQGRFEGEVKSKHLYPAQFAKLVTRTTQMIHDRIGARVLSGGVSSGDPNFLNRAGPFQADGVAIHFYNIWAGDDVNAAPGGPWFNTVRTKVAEYTSVAGGRGLYLTEWGTQSVGHDATRDLIAAFFADTSASSLQEAYFFSWCDCQDPVAQSLTKNGAETYPELWKTWRDASGASEIPQSLGSRCRPDPTQSCENEGDPGCFIASNFVCESGGNGACGGLGPQTTDCDHCCELPGQGQPPAEPPPPEEPPPGEPPPEEPPPPACHCEGHDQNDQFVQTDICGDVTCSTDGQQWICQPGSVDYQPNGNFDLCSGG